jgi:sugar/nucleoside kinase (ribokinase family)
MAADAVVAGHICIDLTPGVSGSTGLVPGRLYQVGPMRVSPGGCVANTGLALSQLGTSVTLAGCAGDDEMGQLLIDCLRRSGADPSGIGLVPGEHTSYSVVIEAPGADRAFWHHPGANRAFDGASLDLSSARLVHLGYPSLLDRFHGDGGARLAGLLGEARRRGVTTSVDLATVDPETAAGSEDWAEFLQRCLPQIDVFVPSVEDLDLALPSGLRRPGGLDLAACADWLLGAGAAVVLLTAGSAGLYLRTAGVERLHEAGAALGPQAEAWADHELWVPALNVEVLATTGAGDAAAAGLLHGLLSGLGAEPSARAAAVVGAARVSRRGVLGSWPALQAELDGPPVHAPMDPPGQPHRVGMTRS